MPQIPGNFDVECGQCGSHYQLSPQGDVAGAACPECGGTRFFRTQPSPTQSDGTLRNMVDSDSQKDEGGNPLGEGTIMGDDGEKPRGFRDNYMHSHVTQSRDLPSEWAQAGVKRIEPMRTLNMEPYAALWDESYLPVKTAGALAELAGPLLEGGGAGGAAGLMGGGGGGGGLSNIFHMALPSIMKGVLGQGQGQQAGSMAPQMPTPAPTMEALASSDIPFMLVADYDTPHSVKSIDEQHDDPEQQDQKEFNDGDKSPKNLKNPNNQDSGASGEDGVRDATEGYGLGPNSPSVERAMMILPLLMHYFQSDESGQNDPLIRGLHDSLEKESPGYLENEHPEGQKYVEVIVQNHKSPHQVQAGVNAFTGELPPTPQAGGMSQNPGGGTCPSCGGVLAGDGSCPQCGSSAHPQGGMQMPTGMGGGMTGMGAGASNSASYPPSMAPRMGTSGTGPQTPEQKAAVIQLLESQGRHGEVQLVELEPWRFAKELDQIQGDPNTAPLVDPSQAQPTPAPMSPMMGAPGSMPVPDPTQMGGGMGQPMQPMAATYPQTDEAWHNFHPDDHLETGQGACPNCHKAGLSQLFGRCQNCGYRVGDGGNDTGYDANHPEGGAFTMQHGEWNPEEFTPHWGKHADANNIIPRCPVCQTATTSVLDGLDGNGEHKYRCHSCDGVFPLSEKKSRVILTDLMNPALQDAGQQAQPAGGEGSTLTWQDAEGRPLVEGQTYELHTSGFDIPEEVKIVSAKPDQLGLKLLGEMNNVHADPHSPDFNIKPQDTQKYTFVPTAEAHNTDGTQPTPLGGMPGLEQIPQQPATTDELSNSYPNQGTMSSVMADQDLSDYDDLCHRCGCDWVTHIASSEATTMHECARCGTAWETHDNYQGREANIDLGWLNDDSQDDFFSDMERAQSMSSYGHQSRNLGSIAAKDGRLQAVRDVLSLNKGEREQRTAGRHFTPSEQRALVSERGTARNLEDLDLSNTHYLTRYDQTGKANGLNAPDEHLILGI